MCIRDRSVSIQWNRVAERSFANILKKFTVTVTKTDAETGTPVSYTHLDVGNREALTRRFFLIFQYEAVGRNESDDYAKIYGCLLYTSRCV